MALDASMDAALKGAAPLVCLMVKMELPGHTITALDGAGQVAFDGETYAGEDAIYGVLDAIETVTEQVGTEAPMVRLTFLPASLQAMADITAPANQGAPVQIWFGVVDPDSGLLITEPEALFIGELDTADVEAAADRTVISFNVASAWERLFDVGEGQRLNNAFIQSIYPGARGAEYVIAIQRDLPWGYDGPRPAVVSDVVGGVPGTGVSPIGGGGGGGGGGFGRVVGMLS